MYNERLEPTIVFFGDGILTKRPGCQSDLIDPYYSLIIKTTFSVHFTIVYANLIDQTTSSIELVVLKRRIIVVIRKDSKRLLLHRLEQHRLVVVKRDLQNFGSTCGSLRKSCCRHDVKNTQPHVNTILQDLILPFDVPPLVLPVSDVPPLVLPVLCKFCPVHEFLRFQYFLCEEKYVAAPVSVKYL